MTALTDRRSMSRAGAAATVPTTPAGARAAVEYIIGWEGAV